MRDEIMEKLDLTSAEKSAIRAILDGACNRDAAMFAGLSLDRVDAVYASFQNSLVEAMIQSAKRFVAESLATERGSLPTSGVFPIESMEERIRDLLRKHGIRRGEEIDDRGSGCSLDIDGSDTTVSPMKSVGLGIGRAVKKYPEINSTPGLKDALFDITDDLMALVEDMPPAERAAFIDQQFAEFVEILWPSSEVAKRLGQQR
jgi:hypothetical protein